MQKEVETIAERGTRAFVSVSSRTEIILKEDKPKTKSWTRYLHVQMNCVRWLLQWMGMMGILLFCQLI